MPRSVRDALFVGIALGVIYLVVRTIKHRGVRWPFTDFLEAVGLVIAPLPVPVLADIFGKAVGSRRLAIFNDTEHRVALLVGAAVLIGAIAFGIVVGLQRAFRPVSA